jgi:hypothetical protein
MLGCVPLLLTCSYPWGAEAWGMKQRLLIYVFLTILVLGPGSWKFPNGWTQSSWPSIKSLLPTMRTGSTRELVRHWAGSGKLGGTLFLAPSQVCDEWRNSHHSMCDMTFCDSDWTVRKVWEQMEVFMFYLKWFHFKRQNLFYICGVKLKNILFLLNWLYLLNPPVSCFLILVVKLMITNTGLLWGFKWV